MVTFASSRLEAWHAEGGRARPAIVGAGFIGRGLAYHLARTPGMQPPLIVNRTVARAHRVLVDAGYAPSSIVISDAPEVLGQALAEGRPAVTSDVSLVTELDVDVLVEATGAMGYGVEAMLTALRAGIHVVSLNAEVDALLGHLLHAEAAAGGAVYTIADGDQPGVLLRMLDEVRGFGLRPVGTVNCKRNLDVHQDPERSRAYAARDNTSVAMTTAFGDGTKMHIENVVVANVTGLLPRPLGTDGVRTTVAEIADDVATLGWDPGWVHYTLGGDFAGGVVVLAASDQPELDAPYLRYGKLGGGPLYPFFRPYHLIHLEVPATILQVVAERRPLGEPTSLPVADCVAIAKRDLMAGQTLEGIGGGACYGVAAPTSETGDLLPVGLAEHATLVRPVARDAPIRRHDVELDDTAELVRLRQRQDRQTP